MSNMYRSKVDGRAYGQANLKFCGQAYSVLCRDQKKSQKLGKIRQSQ